MDGTAVPDMIETLVSQGAAASPAFPLTAWEQAVTVSIFSVVFVSLIVYVFNWQAKQQKVWQDFMEKQNLSWQNYLTSSETRVAHQLGELANTLTRLADKLDAHDDKVESRISRVERRQYNRRVSDRAAEGNGDNHA